MILIKDEECIQREQKIMVPILIIEKTLIRTERRALHIRAG